MYVKFWGVRGSIPSPGPKTVKFGGNTSCVEVRPDKDTIIILDSGSGIRPLGFSLMASEFGRAQGKAHLFFTHTHWDHIQGFPFFVPAYIGARDDKGKIVKSKSNQFHIYGRENLGKTIGQSLEAQMDFNFFPVGMNLLGAALSFKTIKPGQELKIGNTKISTHLVNHPGGCLSYRIENNNKSVVYCTDHEHEPNGKLDPVLLKHCNNADLFIYDAMYTTEEYHNGKVGWGHSTPEEGIKIAKAANVRKFILFHFDPIHDDEFIQQMENDAKKIFPESIAAREGLIFEL
ncbi:MBL fold metallo-hydrolase [Candidatus Riflebacteria bacterium]